MTPEVKEVIRALLTGIIYSGMIQRDPIRTGVNVYVPNGSVESALSYADEIIKRVEDGK